VLLTEVGLISHLLAAIGFVAMTASVLSRAEHSSSSLWLAGAAIVTAGWATIFVFAARFGAPYVSWLGAAETVRSATWIAFIIAALRVDWRTPRMTSAAALAAAVAIVTMLQLAYAFDLADAGDIPRVGEPLGQLLLIISRLIVAIAALVLLNNLYSNAAPASRPGIRLLSIGLAGFFIYDLNLYTLQFLLGEESTNLFNIRGAVDVIVVPLLLLSTRAAWVSRVQVSRQVAFHTLSLSIIGGYLILMAIAAYGLRLVGGDWGMLLQITFLFATIIFGAVVVVSPRFRAALRVQIAKNFFSYKYDYRQEWLRFINTVSHTDTGAGALAERVIEAVCVVVDSPGGALYTPNDDGAFEVSVRWNWREFAGTPIATGDPLVRFLADRHRIVNLDELRAGREHDGLVLPEWAAKDRRGWLIVPLLHLDHIVGIIVLDRTVAQRSLNWEDYDLLRTLGRQAASYIAEAATQAALDEAGKFDEFNRRFAFIMHDIKNLVSQLSLVARNAERHADNPAFRADMVATLQSSVGKMNDLLARLAQHNIGRAEVSTPVDIRALLAEVVAAKRRQHPPLDFAATSDLAFVDGDPGRLEQLFGHLVQNAIEASRAEAPIHVRLACTAGNACIEIADRGHGMSAAFLRRELFKPFRSTKAGGFGIGAYEAREIARAAGGRLDVSSHEGEGTVFTVQLPLRSALQELKRA